jgi:hypothetical protein
MQTEIEKVLVVDYLLRSFSVASVLVPVDLALSLLNQPGFIHCCVRLCQSISTESLMQSGFVVTVDWPAPKLCTTC